MVGQTVADILDIFKKNGLQDPEIIVVNDGSRDATEERAKDAGARVITHPHNVGYGASLKHGIKSALHDTIVISDADGTYPITAIPELLREYNSGFDMVVGARQGIHYHQSFLKKHLRNVLRWMVEFISGRVIPDINSGLRVFSRKTVLPLFPPALRHLQFYNVFDTGADDDLTFRQIRSHQLSRTCRHHQGPAFPRFITYAAISRGSNHIL